MKSQLLRISPRRFINLFVTVLICFFTTKVILNQSLGGEVIYRDEDIVTEGLENLEHTHSDDKMCQVHNRDCIQKVTTTEPPKSWKKIVEEAELKPLTQEIISSYQKRFYFSDELSLITKNLTENYQYPIIDRTVKPILQLVIPHIKDTLGPESYKTVYIL